jgi:hypothetical protein
MKPMAISTKRNKLRNSKQFPLTNHSPNYAATHATHQTDRSPVAGHQQVALMSTEMLAQSLMVPRGGSLSLGKRESLDVGKGGTTENQPMPRRKSAVNQGHKPSSSGSPRVNSSKFKLSHPTVNQVANQTKFSLRN